jgi:hypothetical protein
MHFAFFGFPEFALAVGIGTIGVALAIIFWLIDRKRFKSISLVAIPGLIVVAMSGALFCWEVNRTRDDDGHSVEMVKGPRELALHDLAVDDPIYAGEPVGFEVGLTGLNCDDLTVSVLLKVKGKAGEEQEIQREMVNGPAAGKSVKVRLNATPKEMGRHDYIIEVEAPKLRPSEKAIPPANLRLEWTIKVIEAKEIKVLYVEGQPRYEFRCIKNLLDRDEKWDGAGKGPTRKNQPAGEEMDERWKAKPKRWKTLATLLLDADEDFHQTDRTALKEFPATLEELNQYDVLILGDCDPNDSKLKNHLKDIAHFALGQDEAGRKTGKQGGGVLFIAGAFHNPHRYVGTPLAKILPVEPLDDRPPPDGLRDVPMRPELTPLGATHPIFRFGPDDRNNLRTWRRLTPMFWHASKYRIKPLGEALAVHLTEKEAFQRAGQDGRHPLIVHQFVGSGRSMFFGFDETWRWRRDDEATFNVFWMRTLRYLARTGSLRAELRLDRTNPYRVGEPIRVTVRLPDDILADKAEVKVSVWHTPRDGKEDEMPRPIPLTKVEGSWRIYAGVIEHALEGRYRFRLAHPDVSATQPNGEQPGVEARVERPPAHR